MDNRNGYIHRNDQKNENGQKEQKIDRINDEKSVFKTNDCKAQELPVLFSTQSESEGGLEIRVNSEVAEYPIEGATIQVFNPDEPDRILYEGRTDENGISEEILLPTPPLEYSMEPGPNQPYSTYSVRVQKAGYDTQLIAGAQILPTVMGEQQLYLLPNERDIELTETAVIGPHTLYGEYPAKIPESEVKSLQESGEIVLNEVVIPEYIVVHDGAPTDSTAKNYYVKYADYIKNVASCEIYATWPEATIQANVLEIGRAHV